MAQAGQLRIGRTQAESAQLLAETEAARHCTLTFEGVRDIRKVVQKAAAGQCCQIAELADVGASLEAADRLQVRHAKSLGWRMSFDMRNISKARLIFAKYGTDLSAAEN